ncbi:(2Fe-2S)-binding protein [Kitasatospora sp. LaBMicrA B282]|uniref:(2Fe-2S)-binding protein n=1 Tax=Kitasatospora sp. LaBMicrA B282 TaxID=3420949 RepID=UPI003D11B2D3
MPARTDPCPPPAATPCTAAYRAFAQVFPDLRIHQPAAARPHDGWVPTRRLLADPALRARLIATEARHCRVRYGAAPRPDVAAGFWLHRYSWPLGLLFTLPWFLQGRVPLPAPGQLASRRGPGGGGPAELALLPTPGPARFACLPEDPAADRPGAHPVPDHAALRAVLRSTLAAHLEPVQAAFRPDLRRGPRTLWGLATDEVVEGLWYAAVLLGEEARAVAALTELLPEDGGAAPFGAAGFRLRRPSGTGAAPTPARTRASCCLFYTLQPAELCAGCPRTVD